MSNRQRSTDRTLTEQASPEEMLSALPALALEKGELPSQLRESAIESKLLTMASLSMEQEVDALRAVLVAMNKVKP